MDIPLQLLEMKGSKYREPIPLAIHESCNTYAFIHVLHFVGWNVFRMGLLIMKMGNLYSVRRDV